MIFKRSQLEDMTKNKIMGIGITIVMMIILGGVGGALAGGPYMGLGERLSALTIHQWLFVLSWKLLVA